MLLRRTPADRIGVVSSTSNHPTTADHFAINLDRGVNIKRFDIVTACLNDGSRTHAIVTHIANPTEANSHLANHISTDLGSIDDDPNSKMFQVNTAEAEILSNSSGHDMPIAHGQEIRLSTRGDILEALGIQERAAATPENMVPAGLIEQSNGEIAAILLDLLFILGPEGAHVNASGISGLATKTSYLLFLIMAIIQHEELYANDSPPQTAVIIFNSKKADLLKIHLPEDKLDEASRSQWQALGLDPRPFLNVEYFLPRGRNGRANSFPPVPTDHHLYAFDLQGTASNLDLVFSHIKNESGTIATTIDNIREALLDPNDRDGTLMVDWSALLTFIQSQPKSGWQDTKKASLMMFRRLLRRTVKSGTTGTFVDSRAANEQQPKDIIDSLRPGDVYVFDIAKLRDYEKILTVGSVIRAVDEIQADSDRTEPFPARVIFYLDELGKYAPAREKSLIGDQFVDLAERGRSGGQILFTAEQSRSAVNDRIIGQVATSVMGMTGSTELSSPGYGSVPQDIRSTITRLPKGEMVLMHSVFRFPVKIKFPKPSWRQ